jgi:hypothetical protein
MSARRVSSTPRRSCVAPRAALKKKFGSAIAYSTIWMSCSTWSGRSSAQPCPGSSR